MWPREAPDIVAARTHAAEYLGRENDVLAGDVQILEGLAECLFAFAFGVDIGGVEEIDAGVDGSLNEFVGSRLIDRADHFPKAADAAEGHGAEAKG